MNNNGLVEEDEEGSYPGDPYDISDIPAMQGPVFDGPTVDDDFTFDQWGMLITGYAPIRDASGKIIAVLGMDMVGNDYLGLYIAKGIIERAGGDIWIKSTEGQGTTVTFTLPC